LSRPDRSPAGAAVVVEPAVVVRVMLDAAFGPPAPAPFDESVTAFQATAITALQRIMEQRHGAILADSVGLGKTHVARAIIAQRVNASADVLVVAPSVLTAHWRHQLGSIKGVRIISHAAMSRRGPPALRQVVRPLVVVDEAHAFRNPATRRYRALASMAVGADLLLVTATPVNNSVHDFMHLVRLFARDNDFADVGAPSLLAAVELAAEGAGDALRRISFSVMVRRTREMVYQTHGTGTLPAGMSKLRFPERDGIRRVGYDLNACCCGGTEGIAADIRSLSFPAHAVAGVVPSELLQLTLLKRLESSISAFRTSLAAHRRLMQEFVDAAQNGFLLDAPSCRTLMPVVDNSVQLTMRGVALPAWPTHLDRTSLISSAFHDISLLGALLKRLEATAHDPKAETLCALIDGELRSEHVLVFTQYRDTARSLWKRLCRSEQVGLIDGKAAFLGASPAGRSVVIQRFAPRANGARSLLRREAVRVLIATDVLSEGLNLQDARAVVSYDLPWNPVRLAQRIGRIDRLGSPHARIVAYAFMPDAGLDAVLGLVKRLRRKLRHIHVVGGDAPRFSRLREIVGDSELHLRERLRVAHAQLPPSPNPSPFPATFVAAIPVSAGRGGAIFCISAGASAALVFVPDRGKPCVEPGSAWTMLEAALGQSQALPAGSRYSRLRRRALDTWRRALGAPPQGVSRAARRAARLLHQWIEHDAVNRYQDCERVDAVLSWLAQPQSPVVEHALEIALRSGTDSDRVGAVCDLVSTHLQRPSRTAPRVLAALELVPLPTQ
jgi:superfamily II DNA or RNA helicase